MRTAAEARTRLACSDYDTAMTLQNRVNPFGELFATPARGLWMGNRGGKFHRHDRTLGARRHVTRAWICCRLEFKNRRREVWGAGYTELFFLDEVTALAAGHRPCFECRRRDARAFAEAWARVRRRRARPRAAAMDIVLHRERLNGRAKRRHRWPFDKLPDGAMVALDGAAWAVRGNALLRWTPFGYAARRRRPNGKMADVLTPPAILRVLAAGYAPQWHPSARRIARRHPDPRESGEASKDDGNRVRLIVQVSSFEARPSAERLRVTASQGSRASPAPRRTPSPCVPRRAR